MKKKILIFLIMICISLFLMPNVFANPDLEGSGGTEGGSGGNADDYGFWNKKFGFKIRVYNSDNIQQGNTIEIKAYDGSWSISALEGWFSGSGDSWSSEPTKLYDYLGIPYTGKSNNYSKLKSIINGAGINLQKGDYVLIEPFTQIGNKWYSFRDIITNESIAEKGLPFHEWYKNAAMPLANAAKVGVDITVGGHKYVAPNNVCDQKAYGKYTSKDFCGYKNNKYIGFGITVVKAENMYPTGNLTIVKRDKDSWARISGAGFRLHSGHNCTGTIINRGITANLNDSSQFEVKGLNPGNYSIYEVIVPSGYAIPDNRCTNVTIKTGETYVATITNDKLGKLIITKKDSNTQDNLSGVGFTLYSDASCSSIVKSQVLTGSDGKATFSSLQPNKYYYYKETTTPSGYVADVSCKSAYVSSGDNNQTVYNTPKGDLKIFKKNSSNDKLSGFGTNTTKFQLFSDSSCRNSVTNAFDVNGGGIAQSPKLTPGTYYLKEVEVKTGYHKPELGDTWYCDRVVIESGKTLELTIENKTECEYKFKSNMSMKERIDLYNHIKTTYSGTNFNALLDMGNITAADACRNIEINRQYNTSCLGAESFSTGQDNFTNTNVSMFTEKYGSYTFCLTTYSLNPKISTTFPTIKTGQNILPGIGNGIVTTGTLKRICYNYGDTAATLNTDTNYSNFSYDKYVTTEVSLDGQLLVKKLDENVSDLNNATIVADYTLPVMYASNKDGRIYYGSCPSGELCKTLDRGIISKFNLNPGTKKLDFNIALNSRNKNISYWDLDSSADCEYTVDNELIDLNSNIYLEFRIVNTNSDNLFLDKVGNIRDAGLNWQGYEDILKTNNNSYNHTGAGVKYEITLTPSIIEDIRDYNKGKEYDDYNFTCKNDGTICISNYLTQLRDDGILEINNSSKRSCVESTRTSC
ncbi:MAG: hypothetical protein IKL65_05940 [Bacilli bacterium]|nr:hypothetical protein [Bacilli bacterium]